MRNFWKNVFRMALKNRASMISAMLIIALGIVMFTGLISSVISIRTAADVYMGRAHIADVFATLEGIPHSDVRNLSEIEGIQDISGKLNVDVRIVNNRNSEEAIVAAVYSFDQDDTLNQFTLKGKDKPGKNDIFLSAEMVKAHDYQIGDIVEISYNGVTAKFDLVGTCTSIAFSELIPEWAIDSDAGIYDIAVIDREQLEKLTGKSQLYTTLGFKLESGYTFSDVRAILSDRLGNYGLKNLCDVKEQECLETIFGIMKQITAAGILFPVLFLGVSVFMLFVVLQKMIARDQSLIGTMKAFGLKDSEMISAYLVQGAVIGLVGATLGNLLSPTVGEYMYEDTIEYFHFNDVSYATSGVVVAASYAIALGTALLATYLSIIEILKVSPAQAMKPPVPPTGIKVKIPTFPKSWGNAPKIAVQNVFRNPMNGFLLVLAVAFSFAMALAMPTVEHGIRLMLHKTYEVSMPFDYAVRLTNPDAPCNIRDAGYSIDHVRYVQPYANYYARITKDSLSEFETITFLPDDHSESFHLTGTDDRELRIENDSIILSRSVAKKLHAKVGDTVYVLIGEMSERERPLFVQDIVLMDSGKGCYVGMKAMPEVFGVSEHALGFFFKAEDGYDAYVREKIKEGGNAEMISNLNRANTMFYDDLMGALTIVQMIGLFGMLSGVLIVFSISLINIRERLMELGTLLILGERESEIGRMLLIEQVIYWFVGIIAGIPLSYFVKEGLGAILESPFYKFVLKIDIGNFIGIALFILVVVLVSSFVQYKTVTRIELTDVLKDRG